MKLTSSLNPGAASVTGTVVLFLVIQHRHLHPLLLPIIHLQTHQFRFLFLGILHKGIRKYVTAEECVIKVKVATDGILHPGMESIPETGYGKLEKVQRRATKMIQGYKYLSYKER